MEDYIIDGQGKKRKAVEVECLHCKKKFLKPERFLKKGSNHYCSHECKYESNKTSELVACALCKKEFSKRPSSMKLSKSGLFFCSRKCKDEGQKLENGLSEIWLPGWGSSCFGYREKAFSLYEHKCELCGWDKHPEVLEVHHIDEDRSNGNSDNLMILCRNCHGTLTLGLAVLEDRKWKRVTDIC